MLQLTLARISDQSLFGDPIVIAASQHAEEIERQAEEIGRGLKALVLEPMARNTAPAIALGALLAPAEVPILIMPSDHLIQDTDAFVQALQKGLPLAEQGYLVTFGIVPAAPETGYGYIKQGSTIAPGVQRVDKFVEKPDFETAQHLLAAGDHFWNGGIFLFRPDAYLQALQTYAPAVLEAAKQAIENGIEDSHRVYPELQAFQSSPSISIDYAVMEKSGKVAVVPVEMGWSDIGSWDALYDVGTKDSSGNAVAGDVVTIESQRCLIHSAGPSVVTVGVEDMIVIATGDAILILPRGESQRVKEAFDHLKALGHESVG